MKKIQITILSLGISFSSFSQVLGNSQIDSIVNVLQNKIEQLENINLSKKKESVAVQNSNDSLSLEVNNRLETINSKFIESELQSIQFSKEITAIQISIKAINQSVLEMIIELDEMNSENDNQDMSLDEIKAHLINITTQLNEKGIEIKSLEESMSTKQLYNMILLVVLFLFLIIIYLVLDRKRQKDRDVLIKKNKEIFEKQIEDGQKLTEWIEDQIKQGSLEIKKDTEIDHSFAKRVADEIIKSNANLSRMDSEVKGHKQLSRSMSKLTQTLKSNGYEIVEMLNNTYKEGMNVIATFIPDENLKEGEQIITRIIKPQINYNGKMIQAAEVQVNQG